MEQDSKLCILRLSAIGDVCHAAAMVHRIRCQRPDIHITWVIGKIEYQLLKDMEGIRFVVFDKKQGKQAFAELTETLGGETFDVLFAMQVAFRANWAVKSIKAKKKLGFDWARSKELHWLFTNAHVAAHALCHVLDGFMDFADAIDIPQQAVSWQIPITEQDKQWVADQVSELGGYAVISPAASKAERNWLPERYALVADHLSSKGLKVVLCGGPADIDKKLGEQISQHSQNIALNLIGKTSLKQMLEVLGQATLVIAPDTGPAHMASTVNTPVVGLYAHSNPRRTGPYNDLDYVVSVYDEVIQEQKGKPWQELPWGTRAKGKDLMERITAEEVIDAVDRQLKRSELV